MNTQNYYSDQNSGYGQQPTSGANQPVYSQQGAWQYYGGAWHPVRDSQIPYGHSGQNSQPPADNKKKNRRGLAAASLVLACALAGFGGSYAANSMTGTGQTVVYKTAQTVPSAQGASTGELSVSDIAETAGQSVVSITTENMVADFFTGGRIVSGAGSGVIISADGYVITNHHVVNGARNIKVTLPDGSEHEATLVGADAATDVAVVKINAEGLVPTVVGDSDVLRVGDFCIAIGNPMGTLGGTVTDGIISALNRELNIEGNQMSLLQMSAAVSPGNSGGGLFNASGQLVGLVNAKSGSSEAEGLGFAIPANTAIHIASQLIENGYVTGRPALGVSVLTVADEREAAEAGVPGPGVYITQVNLGSGAAKAGIEVGDQIMAVDGKEISTDSDLGNAIREKEVGAEITISLSRKGSVREITAILGEMSAIS